MSKIEYVEHKCDVCGAGYRVKRGESTNSNSLKSIDIPAKSYDCEGRSYSKQQCTIDICNECYEKFWEFVQSKYDVSSTISGIEINVKDIT